MANALPGVIHASLSNEATSVFETAFASATKSGKKRSSTPSASKPLISPELRLAIDVANAVAKARASEPEKTAPSERWQRDTEVEELHMMPDAPRRTQRVYDGIRHLRREGRITDAHVVAAYRWVGDYEWCLTSSYVDPLTAGIRGNNCGPENRLAGGVDAQTRYVQACRAVGVQGDMLLRSFVAEGKSLRLLEREVGKTRKKLSDMLVETLERLSTHYDEVGRWGRRGILEVRKVPDEASVAQPSTMAA